MCVIPVFYECVCVCVCVFACVRAAWGMGSWGKKCHPFESLQKNLKHFNHCNILVNDEGKSSRRIIMKILPEVINIIIHKINRKKKAKSLIKY